MHPTGMPVELLTRICGRPCETARRHALGAPPRAGRRTHQRLSARMVLLALLGAGAQQGTSSDFSRLGLVGESATSFVSATAPCPWLCPVGTPGSRSLGGLPLAAAPSPSTSSGAVSLRLRGVHRAQVLPPFCNSVSSSVIFVAQDAMDSSIVWNLVATLELTSFILCVNRFDVSETTWIWFDMADMSAEISFSRAMFSSSPSLSAFSLAHPPSQLMMKFLCSSLMLGKAARRLSWVTLSSSWAGRLASVISQRRRSWEMKPLVVLRRLM
mmetsp:Transcript_17935/g.40539  ORF Transcript_17935/g.40539 Transcript_17935/m.40539 type:complete len:270 (-) Transcript_17935:1987-2796(-)